jgi:hypothetical protein
LDTYRAGRKLAPVFIFIHGGAARSGRSTEFAGPAELFRIPPLGPWEGRQCGNSGDGGTATRREVPPGTHIYWINRGLRV